jgi:1-acyl-sn-glycerol-3-phosphate acyltransferase
MARTLWVLAVALVSSLVCGFSVLVIALFRSTSPLIDPIIRFWGRTIIRAAGIELRSDGLERIRSDQRYILVANHYSYLDIPCLFASIPQQPIRFMAKKSLFSIPIFGWALSRAGFIPIDRKDRRTAVKSFELAVQRIRKGNTIVVFPEEGRTRVREMREFQRGGFLLAIRSELPIVPIAIDSTFDILPVGSSRVKPGPVTIRVGAPIATSGLSVRDKQRLALETRQQIGKMLFGDAWLDERRSKGTDSDS